jgi:chromosome segregation ATPase
MINTIGYLCE